MKEIDYTPKITSATTQYNQISDTDMSFIQEQLLRYLAFMGELKANPKPAVQTLVKEYWSKRSATLPKGHNGLNSPETFVSGLVNNLVFGTQQDLSDIQMQALTNISHVMAEISINTKKLEIQKTQDPFESMMFKEKLFEWSR